MQTKQRLIAFGRVSLQLASDPSEWLGEESSMTLT